MAQRNGAAVHVEALTGKRQLALNGAGLGRERLVDLDQIHVFHGQSGLCQRCPRCRHRSDSHHRRIHTHNAPRYESSERFELALARKLFTGDYHRASPIADARSISSGHDAALSEYGLGRSQPLQRRIGPQVLVDRELLDLSGLWIGDRDGHNFILEYPLVPRRLRELLRSQRELVHAPAIQLVPLCQVLRGLRHSKPDVRIGESLPQCVLHRRRLAEGRAPSDPPNDVRRLRHRLGSPNQTELGVAENDLLRPTYYSLKTGAAEAIERERRGFLATSRLECDVTGEVDGIAGRVEDVAEDRLIDIGRSDSRALDGNLRGVNGKVDGGETFQLSPEGAERRSNRGKKDHARVF